MISLSIYNTITKQLREEFFEWILYHTNVNPSCVPSDIVNVLNPELNKKEFFQFLMDIYAGYLHNDMIKPTENGGLTSVSDSVTHKLLIIDTTFR